ncbi:MAG: PQQ-binding-like beta-propeller repeat protein [Phycisphaerae bacterium]
MFKVAICFLAWAPASTIAPAADNGASVLDQWPQFRGPLGTGVAPHGHPPIAWSETNNIRWKTPIPGLGHSSPIVWGDRIFLTTAIPFGDALPGDHGEAHGAHNNVPPARRQAFVVLAVNRRDGRVLWQKTVRKQRPHESTHESGTWASNSPVTDGTHVFAYFGSHGLYCLDFEGALIWQTDVGTMHTKHGHGEGSSPALHGDTIVVNFDHEGQSFVIAIDKRTGKQRWRVQRDEGTSWSTPLVVDLDGRPQVIVAATRRVRAYDLLTGRVVWECGGLSGNVVASPVAADGIVYVTNSYETREMLAIRLAGAHGDITNTDAVVWSRHRHTPYVPSPLLYGDKLYFLKHYQGFLTCVQAKTGANLFGPERLQGIANVYASIAAAADRVYVVSRNGNTAVISGGTFRLIALNHLDDSFSASPAMVDHELFLRGERFLYCIVDESTP